MRIAGCAILLCAGIISAQDVPAPGKAAALAKLLEPHANEQTLPCSVNILKPTLDYAFRFESGYTFRTPLHQYSEPDRTWTVITQVSPQDANAQPVYLVNVLTASQLTQTGPNADIGASGGFIVGEGRYQVKWLLLDGLGRACRKSWSVEASRNGKFVSMPPGTVAGLSLRAPARTLEYKAPGTPMRLTVLLDAAPLQYRSQSVTKLNESDQAILFDGLLGLMQRLPAGSVRLIVFNLEQQRILFRQEDFTVGELDSVARVLSQLELGVVQREVLARPKGQVDLLTTLVNSEIRSAVPADAVVFLGPQERYVDAISEESLDMPYRNQPAFFAVQFVPLPRWVFAPSPQDGPLTAFGRATPITSGNFDTITHLVKKLKGTAVQVRTAGELERAIERIKSSH